MAAAPKYLFFDVGGTVFDWKKTVFKALDDAGLSPDIDADDFANDWRREMFLVRTKVAGGNLPWMNADEMHLRALKTLDKVYPFLSQLTDLQKFTEKVWHNLLIFDGAAEAIKRLRSQYTVIVLTILSFKSTVLSSKRAGLEWDGILSCEFLGYYKPSLQAYLKAAQLVGAKPENIMMVAAHEADLAAAKTAGLQTAFVGVPNDDNIFDPGDVADEAYTFDVTADNFSKLFKALEG